MGRKKHHNNKSSHEETLLLVDPIRIRFQHSRIRSQFSGCGRGVVATLDSIRRGEIKASDLPPIQVIVGHDDGEGPWYFSLNNRRLWVLKRCREEGLLQRNQIQVRAREPKSSSERARYTLGRCSLEAKLMDVGGQSISLVKKTPSASVDITDVEPDII